jgi:Baseplate J-like protein
MTQLALDLFKRSFSDLMEIGRAKLPALAPDWTDHNAHDPGITLMELLAWVAEAQLYSLSRRPRRDERAAYAALMGFAPGGTQPARGLIWPDRGPASAAATFAKSVVIPTEAVINVMNEETPTFRPSHKLLFVPGRIERLETRLPGGPTDHTAVNERGGTPFFPFGETASSRDVLAMTFRVRGDAGLFGPKREKGALWAIGVRAVKPLETSDVVQPAEQAHACRPPVTATLVADGERFPLTIVSDSTNGLLESGALLLDLDNVTSSPQELTIELRSPGGFARPPRLLRIEPNAVPVEQGRPVARELHIASGQPDFSFNLDVPGLRFAPGEEPVKIEIDEPTSLNVWKRIDRLSDHGPDERVYELDARRGLVTFGNGINGYIPPSESQVLATYAVSDAEKGNVARNRQWRVTGFEGAYGVNFDPIAGGAAAAGWIDQRREARHRSEHEHALVSSDDIAAAAKELPLLEVARAWVLPPNGKVPRTGAVTLIAMRARPNGKEPAQIPETRRWLEAVRRQLAGRMPLGTRLVVAAPSYVDFFIRATVIADVGRDPSAIETAVTRELAKRLSLIDRRAGVPLTYRDVAAWLRSVEGVKSIAKPLLIRAADGKEQKQITVLRSGLPRLTQSTITVRRPGSTA